MNAHRINIIGLVQIFASDAEQNAYRQRVQINVVDELICQWFDDFYHPGLPEFAAAFSESELMKLSWFNDFLDRRSSGLSNGFSGEAHSPMWDEIVQAARSVLDELGWDRAED